ncbi:MAG: hypothetical protein ACPG47_07910 [Leucothrix sp.]
MKRSIFLFVFIFSIVNQAQASCLWTGTNALTTEVMQAQALLKEYAKCRVSCQAMANKLKQSVTKMRNAPSCSAHIYTRSNKALIDFIAGRFKLIQKQKQGWMASAATAKPVETLDKPNQPLVMSKPAFIPPEPVAAPAQPARPTAAAPFVEAPQRVVSQPQPVAKQTKMKISREAYSALWDEPTPPQQKPRRPIVKKPALNHLARQKQLAKYRLIQQRKQALIQQQKLQLVRAKKRAMQQHLHQERIKRQRLLERRALARQLHRKRIQQRKAAMAKRNAR